MADQAERLISPLSRTVEGEGTWVRISIQRRADTDRWVLAVVDEAGDATIWRDTFETDAEALAAALRTIEEEGITSFLQTPGATVH